ncbi:MAG: hypothetical protein GQ532_09260 [Methylomarinum sp.]|nr:hypothetical protein [Methylomarinum sp.]
MKISYTPESINDLTRLREFIKVKNPLSAQRVANSILKGINQLNQFPYLGTEVQLAPNPEMIRDLIVANYIIRYLVQPKRIDVLRVWHHKKIAYNQAFERTQHLDNRPINRSIIKAKSPVTTVSGYQESCINENISSVICYK